MRLAPNPSALYTWDTFAARSFTSRRFFADSFMVSYSSHSRFTTLARSSHSCFPFSRFHHTTFWRCCQCKTYLVQRDQLQPISLRGSTTCCLLLSFDDIFVHFKFSICIPNHDTFLISLRWHLLSIFVGHQPSNVVEILLRVHILEVSLRRFSHTQSCSSICSTNFLSNFSRSALGFLGTSCSKNTPSKIHFFSRDIRNGCNLADRRPSPTISRILLSVRSSATELTDSEFVDNALRAMSATKKGSANCW